jgi:hypothetical protein
LSLIGKRKQSAEIAKPKANLHRQETEAENTWMGSELLQIIRRNKFDLNLTSFFKVKHHHAAVRSTDDNECMDRLTKLGDNVEYRVKKVLPKRHVLEANDIIRKNVTQLKAEERHLTKSYSMMKTKRRSLSSENCEPVDSHGIRRNKSFSSKLEKSQLAKSLVGNYNTPYEFRLLSKIINNLKKAGKVREDRRVTVLTTDVSEIEHSRSHSNKITPPNFSQLIGSYTTK